MQVVNVVSCWLAVPQCTPIKYGFMKRKGRGAAVKNLPPPVTGLLLAPGRCNTDVHVY